MVEGEGFEPSKAVPADLQSDPFGHSGTPPQVQAHIIKLSFDVKRFAKVFLLFADKANSKGKKQK